MAASKRIRIENRTESTWDFGLLDDDRNPVRWGRAKDRLVPEADRDDRFRPNPVHTLTAEQLEKLPGRDTLLRLIELGDFQRTDLA